MSLPSIWSAERRSPGRAEQATGEESGHRTVHEQDYDRILFSTSVRRLSDKTQVFPLDTNDGVRTRLTHSHEVANLAKSIGLRLLWKDKSAFGDQDFFRTVLPILAACGLSHDLGNPPFGHQGEAAIAEWFEERKGWIFDRVCEHSDEPVEPVDAEFRSEFLEFDGNPQSLRLISRLHPSQGGAGLDLTASTIMATLKYPVGANNTDKNHPSKKKFGYFCSEADVIAWARERTGLSEGQRHPLAWITEAADDSAYSVLDVEDSMKKGIISPDDLITILKNDLGASDASAVCRMGEAFDRASKLTRSPSIIRDIKIGYARSYLIEDLVIHATEKFSAAKAAIWDGSHREALMDSSPLCEALKGIAREYAFGNSEVLLIEANGRAAIAGLLDQLWLAITDRKKPDDITSKRKGAVSKLTYSIISPNYIEAASSSDSATATSGRMRYRELRLLTDMVAGMTDHFSMNLSQKIKSLK